jgi:hypothetical protein
VYGIKEKTRERVNVVCFALLPLRTLQTFLFNRPSHPLLGARYRGRPPLVLFQHLGLGIANQPIERAPSFPALKQDDVRGDFAITTENTLFDLHV